jgi:FAD/FMN-containing dehydrogenase
MSIETRATAPAAPAAVDALTTALAAAVTRVHRPGSPAYDELTATMNALVRPTPAVVVEVTSADEVARTVRIAAAFGVPVAVMTTGHGTEDTLDGTVLVATRALDELVVRPAERTARVGAGLRWRDVLAAAAPYGLAGLCGSSPSVGVVGFLTGGGVGPLVRSHGLSVDRVLAFEVVTGDGEIRRASADSEPDLYWGLRGGRATLGIVTAVELELVELAEVYGGSLWFDEADIPAMVRTWAVWSTLLPDEGTTSAAILRLPPMPDVPPFLAGKTVLHVRFVWTGDPAVGAEMIEAMRGVVTPLADSVALMPYERIGEVHADPDAPMPMHTEHVLLERLDPAGVELLLDLAGPGSAAAQLMVEVRRVGGALERPLRGETAFTVRDAEWTVFTIGLALPGTEELVAADARRIVDGLAPVTRPGGMPNFVHGFGVEWARRVFPAGTAARLAELSRRYDPAGVLLAGQAVRELSPRP